PCGVGPVRGEPSANGVNCRPPIAREAGCGGERCAMAFRRPARGLRVARLALCPARLPRAPRGGRAHGRAAARAARASQDSAQAVGRSPGGCAALELPRSPRRYRRAWRMTEADASAVESRYDSYSKSILPKGFIERERA